MPPILGKRDLKIASAAQERSLRSLVVVTTESMDIMLLNIEKIWFEINLLCVENTHRGCIYNKEHMG